MFERPQTGTRAVLVHVDFRSDYKQESREEFQQLAVSAGVEPVAAIGGTRGRPDPRLFIGAGKATELLDTVKQHDAEVVLFNHALSPVQERNLERHLSCRVLDRTGLILDIFAQRARTFEGKLQVELAQLKHLATRLVRGWSHLERQKGGIGLRGPGETQLETDRRLVGKRIKQLNKRLERVRRHRQLSRSSRHKATVSSVSLVGYTNAGKSTLFNRLTGSEVYQADQLFATLDPTLRRLELPGYGHAVVADTVGFISELPPDLVAAFRATLEETVDADLLLHVIDAHDEHHDEQVTEVNRILREIGAADIAQLEVYNKIDLRDGAEPRIDYDADGQPKRVWISARDGRGIDMLENAIAGLLLHDHDRAAGIHDDAARSTTTGPVAGIDGITHRRLCIQPSAGRLRSKLFEWDVVRDESFNEAGEWIVDVVLRPGMLGYLQQHRHECRILPSQPDAGSKGACEPLDVPLKSVGL